MAIWLKRRRRGGQAHTDVQALQHAVTELEKERDFYYGKLRSVELLCQNAEEDTQGSRRRRHPPTPALFLRAAQTRHKEADADAAQSALGFCDGFPLCATLADDPSTHTDTNAGQLAACGCGGCVGSAIGAVSGAQCTKVWLALAYAFECVV